MAGFVTRFAPSPTGLLHLGHAYSALMAHRAAQEAGGRFILRIEDIDQTRCKPEFEEAIYEDLAWLGLNWETPVRRQSEHFVDYETALRKLRDLEVIYRCFKTRKEVAEAIASAPHYSVNGPEGPQFVGSPLTKFDEDYLLKQGEPFAWRLYTQRAVHIAGNMHGELSFIEEGEGPKGQSGKIDATPEIFGDPVIARKDSLTSYHLACVYDDAFQGVTHVIRGADLFYATHLHCLLQVLLGMPAPIYRHHQLITDETGKRFAKRDKSVTLQEIRKTGASPAEVRARLGFKPG
jgi:glutamyl-Q tRNA(Asp) synthetase